MKQVFSVKNWDAFQHYKDRNPPWIKLHNHLLDDYEFECLPDATKCHLLCIWMLASRTNNEMIFDSAWVKRKIGANSNVDLDLLVSVGFIELQGAGQDASKVLVSEEKSRDREEKNIVVKDSFEHWWSLYPSKRRTDKAGCLSKWTSKCKSLSLDEIESLANEVSNDVSDRITKCEDLKFYPQTTTYLNKERWKDGQ